MHKRSEKSRSRRSKTAKKKEIIYISIVAIVIILMSVGGAYILYGNMLVKQWQDKIYSGVEIKGIDLSGKTKEDALVKVKEELSQELINKKINIVVGDKAFNYTYSDIDAEFDVEDTVEKAVQFGKDAGFFEKISLIRNKNKEPHNIDMKVSYDESKINEIKDYIKSQVNISKKNAQVSIINGQVHVEKEASGYSLDEEEFASKFKEAINSDLKTSTDLKYELIEDKPDETYAELSKIKDKLSTFSTSYSIGDRGYNLELVTNSLNGKVLMPGEEFSYSDFTQSLRGKYKDAGGYVNNKVVQVEGGGICQVCTTLYRAVMRANIRSIERHNHSSKVGYALPGLDATVAWGYLDYKFKNTYDFPIYIEGIGGNGIITFNIYGAKEGLNGCTYDIVAEDLGTDAQGFSRANSYFVTYKDGKEINREFIAKDTYAPLDTN